MPLLAHQGVATEFRRAEFRFYPLLIDHVLGPEGEKIAIDQRQEKGPSDLDGPHE